MKKHKILGWLFLAFIAFYVLSSPLAAAASFSGLLSWCGSAAGALATFVGAVTS